LRAVVEATRSGIVESRHEIHAVTIDMAGERFRFGDPGTVAYMRSAAKPFQAIGVILSGAAAAFRLEEADLAVIAASHGGETMHTERVAAMLKMAGLDTSHLKCGIHPPHSAEAAAALDGPPNELHSNCSGNHTGMLLSAVHGSHTLDYLSPEHPVQQANLAIMAAYTGLPPEEIGIGVDGCGVPAYAVPVSAMARAYLRLVRPDAGIPSEMAEAGQRIARAMARHPYLVGGRGEFTSEAMVALGGRLVAKGGAEAVFCAAVPEEGVAMALKVADGAKRAVPPAASSMLARTGVVRPEEMAALRELGASPLRNIAGRLVGSLTLHIFDGEEGAEAS